MAAWSDMADDAYDAAESLGLSGDNDPYEWAPECDAAELCAAIDAAVYTFGRLADETATLTTFARRVA